MKLHIKDKEISIDMFSIFDGKTIDESIEKLNSLRTYIQSHHVSHKFECHVYYESFDLSLVLFKEECDDEYKKRLSKERKKIENDELKKLKQLHMKFKFLSQEQIEYDRLCEKYGNPK